MEYGYVRVSSKDQNEERQFIAMKEAGLLEHQLYMDKQSGKDFNRPAYRRLLRKLKKGDVLYVKSIDRLGRNYEEIQNQWRFITREKRVDIVVLDMPLLDTRNARGDLTGVFISDLVLQILSYVAQTERENIKQRQAEGIAAARQRGVRLGRPKKRIPDGFIWVMKQWESSEIGSREAARRLGVSQHTFLKWVHEKKEENLR